jgi:hypothetical protein
MWQVLAARIIMRQLVQNEVNGARRAIARGLSRMRITMEVDGIDQLTRQLQRIEKIPKSIVAKAANAGIKDTLRDARQKAPVDFGNLRKGIIKIKEKSPRSKPKVVYSIVFDRSYNSIFQKPVKNPGPGKKDTAYYPVSQEYGYRTKSGGYVPGFRFVRDSLKENQATATKRIVEVLNKEIDKRLR